ncbi:hypothetical protein H1R20_g10124, partial [Candolleomyces eurysporus]
MTDIRNKELHGSGWGNLPEELVLGIISQGLGRSDCLSLCYVNRALNRIVIGHILAVNGIKRPASYFKVILDPDPISPFDVLSVLSHSVHVKDFVKLVFGFSKVKSLSTSLRRVASFLRSSHSFQSITFLYAIEYSPFPAPNTQKEVVKAFQELFDAVFSKPIKQIIFQGTPGRVGQFYQFSKDLDVSQTATLRSKLLKGIRKYLGRSVAKPKENTRDAIILDDKRYKQSPRLKPRIQPLRYTHPDVTNLAYLTIAGLDFLCPPFSQWIYPMLNASKLQHFRLVFQSRPADLEEVKFILRRLASAMPHLPKLRVHDFRSDIQTLGVLMEGISAFANLEFLVMQTDPTPSDKLKLESDLEQLRNDLKIGLESPSSSAGTNLKLPPTFKFSPESRLRRIVASPDVLEFLVATTIGSNPQETKLLPCLESVKILYTFDKMTRFSPKNLAKCLKSIKVLAPETISVRLDFKNRECLEFPKLIDNGHGVSDGGLDLDVLNIRKEISQVGELDLRFPKTRGEIFADLKETAFARTITIMSIVLDESVSDGTSPGPIAGPERVRWGGILFFKVEQSIFEAPRYRFAEYSEVFETMFQLPAGNDGTVEGQDEAHPIILEGYQAAHFCALLKILYPTFKLEKEEWIGVLNLSTRWSMKKIRKHAINELSEVSLNPIEKITLGREHKVAKWFRDGLTELVSEHPVRPLAELKSQLGTEMACTLLWVQNHTQTSPGGLVITELTLGMLGCFHCQAAMFTSRNCASCSRTIAVDDHNALSLARGTFDMYVNPGLTTDGFATTTFYINLKYVMCKNCSNRALPIMSYTCPKCSQDTTHLGLQLIRGGASVSQKILEEFGDEIAQYESWDQ